MLNTIFFYFLMLLVVGVPFFFQYRMKGETNLSTINKLTAKLSATIIGSLYGMSFLAFQIKNTAYSKVGFCACIFAFFLLYSFRGKLIQHIREIPANPKERFERSFRTLLAMTLMYAGYYFTIQVLAPIISTLPAIIIAIAMITYASPVLVRVWMPVQKMHPSPLKEAILNTFTGAKNPVKEVYLIDTDRFKSYNAMVCGPKYGFGPFQRSVFLTRNLFEVLETEEIHAVMCHEASHFKLNHVVKRGAMSIVGIMIALFTVVLPVALLSMILQLSTDHNFGLLIISTIGSIYVQMAFLYRVIRKQEFEADLEAINIGASSTALISALEKITAQNGMERKKEDGLSRFMFGHAHPSVEERAMAIQTMSIPQDTRIFPQWKAIAGYASAMSALFILTYYSVESRTTNRIADGRNPASNHESGQNLPTTENTIEQRSDNSDGNHE